MFKETTGYVICRTARKIHQYLVKCFKAYGITPEQWVIIQILSESENISQRELSERLEKDANSVKALVERLIQKNLINRMRCATDQRVYNLFLTNQGRLLFKNLREYDEAFMAEIEYSISATELKTFMNIIYKFEDNVDKKL